MNVNRVDLLKRLLAVSPGLTPTDTIKQSSCVIIKKGRLYTLNREVACSIKSNLDESWLGALQAKKLIEMLKKLNEETIDVEMAEGRLVINGHKRGVSLVMEAEVFLPVGMVELPKTEDYIRLDPAFVQAVDLVHRCTRRKSPDFAKTCVHVHPKHLEASDNTKMARWGIDTFVAQSVLVRGITLKTVVPLGMTKACETINWLHFTNPFGLRVSLKKWPVDFYAPLDEFLSIRGEKAVFPKALAEAADIAGLLLDDVDGSVKVTISESKVRVEGAGTQGEYYEEKAVSYEGKPMTFLVPPKLIGELVDQQSSCEISEACLRVATESYVYLTSLELEGSDA